MIGSPANGFALAPAHFSLRSRIGMLIRKGVIAGSSRERMWIGTDILPPKGAFSNRRFFR